MEKGLISVVIPAYNVEEYIRECLESVFLQDYPSIEVIAVNDGSTDGTLDILREYESVHPNMKLIENEENIGLGETYFKGLSNINGEYFITLDSDDYLKGKSYISTMYDVASKTDSDIVVSNMFYLYEDGTTKQKFTIEDYSKTYDGFDKFNGLGIEGSNFTRNKMYRSILFEKVGYCKRRFIEDTPTLYRWIYYANRIAFADTEGYMYRIRKSSLMNSNSDFARRLYQLMSSYDTYDFFKDKEGYEHIYTIFSLRNTVGGFFLGLNDMNEEIYHSMKKELKMAAEYLTEHIELIPKNQLAYYKGFIRMVNTIND